MLAEETLARAKRVEIRAKKMVDTLLQSSYRSVFRGRGIEFSEVREYMEGDDIRYVDWNVTARTGRLYVKEFKEERDLLVYILVDISASTSFGSSALKREKAALAATTLAYSACKGNDRVGLLLFSDKVEKVLKPTKGRGVSYKVAREMVTSGEARATSLLAPIEFISRVLKERAVIFFISDLIAGDLEACAKKLKELERRGNDVIAIKLEDPRDYSLQEVGLMGLEDPESGEQITIDTTDRKLREEYSRLALEREKHISRLFRGGNVDLLRVSTSEDLFKPLVKFFRLREKRRRRA